MNTDFYSNAQADIDKRTQDLTEIHRALFTKRYSLSNKHYELLSAHSISIIYSIWEGFFSYIFSIFIDEINSRKIDFYDLHDGIVCFHMEKNFNQFHNFPEKISGKYRFFVAIKDFHVSNHHAICRVINTESNVGFDVLNKNLSKFGIAEFPQVWGKYIYPNSDLKTALNDLLKCRNAIAHGDANSSIIVSVDVYDRYKKLVLDLMNEILIRMLDCLKNENFRKKS